MTSAVRRHPRQSCKAVKSASCPFSNRTQQEKRVLITNKAVELIVIMTSSLTGCHVEHSIWDTQPTEKSALLTVMQHHLHCYVLTFPGGVPMVSKGIKS